MTAPEATAEERRNALVERLFGAVLGMIDLHVVYLGDRLAGFAEVEIAPIENDFSRG
jgi:hypothetical protein